MTDATATTTESTDASADATTTDKTDTTTETTEEAGADEGSEKTSDADPETPDFKLPDEYKDKPWADKVKSQEDLYKQIDNLNTLVGKKSIALDFENSTPEQIEEYLSSTRPETQEVYTFGEGAEEGFTGEIGKILFDAGISKFQGDQIIKNYEALEAQATNADNYTSMMKDRFGDSYDAVVTHVTQQFEQHLSKVDQDKLLERVPNEFLGIIYQLTSGILKAHGAEESGTHPDNKSGQIQGVTFDEQASKLRKEMKEMKNRAHTADEYSTKVKELDALYQNRNTTKGRK